MKLLSLCSGLNQFNSCKEFIDEFKITKNDLIITCSYIYDDFFKDFNLEAQVVFQDKYGNGEPTDEMIQKMIDSIDFSYERIFGIGGGTVMDISKLFALKQMTPLVDLFTGKIKTKKKCPLILIPTTCGTGSEVTNVSIVGFPSLDTKLRLAVDQLYADEAVFIPELIKHLPRGVFATSSIDALIHAIESSLSPLATPYSQIFGHKAMEMIIDAYKQIRDNGFDVLDSLLDTFLIASVALLLAKPDVVLFML
ncbi:MAG: iron-containing alcohol dehydrogenase [Eubacterium sp.]|uniref:iron-containing alcohol dehydrogenase n=1 Tax=Eubacterium sp. TaxID=142586 RepID=UPI0039942670